MSERAPSDPEQFGTWVRPHWPGMAKLARRLALRDWEDVLQEALSAAWRKRAQFDGDRGTARNWLLAIVADQAAKSVRGSGRRSRLVLVDRDGVEPAYRDPDLHAALHRLPTRQRIAVTLYYFLDLPVNDVAAVMRCAPGTVKSTLSDARTRLRTELGDGHDT